MGNVTKFQCGSSLTYAAVRDDQGDFQGVLEYVQDIQPFFELESDLNRDID